MMYNLTALQNKEVQILQAVHEACKKMNIEYTIGHGTLIGAVRHKGFIPWDDDIDICMTRESYDKFIQEGEKYLPENLKIQHALLEDECPNIFAKVRDSNTTFLHAEHVDLKINQGVFIDIFPVDKIQSGRINALIEHEKRRAFNIINECYDIAYIKTIKRPMRKLIGYLIYYIIVHGVMHGIKRKNFILHEENRRRKLHYRGDNCTFISLFRNITGPYSLFTERTVYPFGDHEFYGPKNYDYILTKLYGDYMTIPPKEKQITHKPLFVDLEKGYSTDELGEILAKLKEE